MAQKATRLYMQVLMLLLISISLFVVFLIEITDQRIHQCIERNKYFPFRLELCFS